MNNKKVKIFYNNNDKSLNIYHKLVKELEDNGFRLDDNNFDYAIAIGGDGSFLRMVRTSNFTPDTLYLGINTGTLGFAQDIDSNDIHELIEDLKTNNFYKEEIKYLKVKIYDSDKIIELNALNEFVFRASDFKTLKLNIEIDNEHLESFVGDGVVISTSFGSTAYNLSLGGAIVYNTFHSMQITPIAPLNSKTYRNLLGPLVFPDNKIITLTPNNTNDLLITFDGENKVFNNINKIEIYTSYDKIKCFRKNGYNFIKKINEKFLS